MPPADCVQRRTSRFDGHGDRLLECVRQSAMSASVALHCSEGVAVKPFRVSAAQRLAASQEFPAIAPNPNRVATRVATFGVFAGVWHHQWQRQIMALTCAFVVWWAMRDSNPRPLPCKGTPCCTRLFADVRFPQVRGGFATVADLCEHPRILARCYTRCYTAGPQRPRPRRPVVDSNRNQLMSH